MSQESEVLFPNVSAKTKIMFIVLVLATVTLGAYVYEHYKKTSSLNGIYQANGKVYYFHNGQGGELS